MDIPALVKKAQPMTVEEEMETLERFSKGETKLKDKIITSNLRYIYAKAKKYADNNEDLLEELYLSGIEALCIALKNFDFEKFKSRCTRFLSYANQIVMQQMAMETTKIRSTGKCYKQIKIRQLFEEFSKKHKNLSRKEIIEKISSLEKIAKNSTIESYLSNVRSPNSIYSETENGVKTIDKLESKENPEIEATNRIILDSINWNLLSETERTVIQECYFKEKSLTDVASTLNYSKEWVRVVHKRAILKIRKQLGISIQEVSKPPYRRKRCHKE